MTDPSRSTGAPASPRPPAPEPSEAAPAKPAPPARPSGPLHRAADVVRGGLIGTAEVVPGVSGGTVALIVGVYEALIGSAGHLVRAAVAAVADPARGLGLERARAHARQVQWAVCLPVGLGMVTAVVIAARILEPVLEEHPVQARAVFAGLILASLVVPATLVGGRWRGHEYLVALAAAAAAFGLTGIPPAGTADPALPLVALAAAFAICALVLPGVSGSFLLLTVGLYEPTIAAVNDRDLAYLGAFALGALVGLSGFVAVLQWLLEHYHRLTLVVMTGLMAGSLRALWPWQEDDRTMLAPQGDVGQVLVLFLVGVAVVLGMLLLESHLQRRHAAEQQA